VRAPVQWEDRAEKGLFRYDVTACETKVSPLARSRPAAEPWQCRCRSVQNAPKNKLYVRSLWSRLFVGCALLRLLWLLLLARIPADSAGGVALGADVGGRVRLHRAAERGAAPEEARHRVPRGPGAAAI
jgi:hypothetical protein